ncbi:MAG: DEAD/DEAH box helicase family protein [Candidatus Marsarchaeota archaeon]|jgi:type III restriction enzyme|nr:DEAD/DEAH box helicase family protein [Candidatus Marsarchaeota archaeon]
MVNVKSSGTKDIPLKLAARITELANKLWTDGNFIEKVTPITKELLKFWNPEGEFSDQRDINFHKGQWQAILNIVYVHEIIKIKDVKDMYLSIYPELLGEMSLLDLKKEKYEYPKYCVKMATGTGKTWVLDALIIWQYLNSIHEETENRRFTKNFLLIAPGIIVYERLLDAYLGKRKEDGNRDFEQSDFKRFETLFVPPAYKNEIFGFIQSCVAQKGEIGKKVTGDGLIAITNWHLLVEDEERVDNLATPLDSPEAAVKKLLPITPGTSAGHSLEELDNQYLRGKELDYLSGLKDLAVFNDEAHHLGEMKVSDEVLEKKWQNALDIIAANKKDRFMQVDFSATPYIVTGSGQNRVQNHFPHIIVDFELIEAIKQGLVKTVAIDKRKEFASIPLDDLDFKAERDGRVVTNLSKGQEIMLKAGITKLKMLNDGFTEIDKTKYPKMLIVCENTAVVPLVLDFLKSEGYSDEELIEIHSNKKGEVSEDEWAAIKQRLFDIDKHNNPKIIVSVLMLREGFDVNNICVIVPLRSSSSYILLEQLIGRGLRLMWREPQYSGIKLENREKLLIKKEEPTNYMDILSIIEHPNFIEYYDRVLKGVVGKVGEITKKEHVIGDIIKVSLKPNYKNYDLFWPVIIHDKEEELQEVKLSIEELEPFPISIEELKPLVNKFKGDIFYGEELTVKTKFGEYNVPSSLFTAKSYNSFIEKLIEVVSVVHVRTSKKSIKKFPTMQINKTAIARLIDEYIRHKLFGKDFEPLKDNNWRVLLITQKDITQHIVRNIAKAIIDMQNSLKVTNATIIKKYFSEFESVSMRETYVLDVAKSIYPKLAYPSNKGGFEKDFMQFIDTDTKVNAFMKINEYIHYFADILYIRNDGLLSHYHPDFIVKLVDNIYIVETKADSNLSNQDVKSKRLATIDWIDKINELEPEYRANCEWHYVLLGEKTFYSMKEQGATTEEILEYAKLNKSKIKGTLREYVGDKEY